MVLLAYMVLGCVAGLLAGLFGIGGGLIIVPALIYAFAIQGVSAEVSTHLAVGTSLATIVVTSLSSVRTHHQAGAVNWPVFRVLAPGIVMGSIAGVFVAASLSGPVLQLAIGCFAICIAIQMGLDLKPSPHRELPAASLTIAIGVGIGLLSAVFGIGGGSLTVPFLSYCNQVMQRAVATAAACGLPLAVAAAITNLVAGWGHAGLPQWSTGYVYWPAFAGIVLTSALFAKYGARLAHRLSGVVLKRCFAALLLFIGSSFVYQAWS
jgi:uncharacterized membrane protein YfcA